MRAVNVFTPGKIPEVTYIDDHLQERAQMLRDALETGAQAIVLSGPSKSGKTVFVEKNLGRDRLIQVTGAGIGSPKDLWDRVFAGIGVTLKQTVTITKGFEAGASGSVTGKVPFLVEASAETTGAWSNESTEESQAPIDYLKLIIEHFANTEYVIFIDDFHYIDKDTQGRISNEIKEAIRNNVNFILALVPYHSDDAVRANSDLRGRAVKIDFNYWGRGELQEIAVRGFAALNIEVPQAYISAMADEAAGSPQLMQALCLHTCFELGIRESSSSMQNIHVNTDTISKVCTRTSFHADYSSTVDKMKDGPKTRGQDRNGYPLKSGEFYDVYPLILKAIASNPPELTIRYQNLQSRISALCASHTPSGSSVTGACAHMCAIANSAEGRNIVEWDGETDVLDIRDPYLLFYIRWGT